MIENADQGRAGFLSFLDDRERELLADLFDNAGVKGPLVDARQMLENELNIVRYERRKLLASGAALRSA